MNKNFSYYKISKHHLKNDYLLLQYNSNIQGILFEIEWMHNSSAYLFITFLLLHLFG